MTVIAEKLRAAGADTVGAQLTTACVDAIRSHPDNVEAAWRQVGAVFGYDLIKSLMRDMTPDTKKGFGSQFASGEKKIQSAPVKIGETQYTAFEYKPRVIPAERLEKRRQLRELVRSKFKNSNGVSWSDVGWHELTALQRDGAEAKALLEAGPANVPNDGRTVGDVLGVKRTDEIIGKFRP